MIVGNPAKVIRKLGQLWLPFPRVLFKIINMLQPFSQNPALNSGAPANVSHHLDANLFEPAKSDWATLNLILSLCGYTLCGALLSPLSVTMGLGLEDSWLINYPIRALQLGVSAYCLFVVGQRKEGKMQWTSLHTLLIVLWAMGILRLLFDVTFIERLYKFSTAWNIGALQSPVRFWFTPVISTISMFSILRTIHLIDFDKAIKWLFWSYLLGAVAALWTMNNLIAIASNISNEEYSGSRAIAGVTLHTQALGGFGTTTAMISFYYFKEKLKGVNWKKSFAVLGMLLGLYLCIKAGSRGPFLSLIVFTGFYMMARSTRYAVVTVPFVAIVGVIGYLLRFEVVHFIGKINPVIETRLLMTLESGDTSGRIDLWKEYWDLALQHPLFGVHSETFGYAHSGLIDPFFQYGFLFGWLGILPIFIAATLSFKLLKSGRTEWWMTIFVLSGLAQVVTQGGIDVLNLVVILYLLKKNFANKNLSVEYCVPANNLR